MKNTSIKGLKLLVSLWIEKIKSLLGSQPLQKTSSAGYNVSNLKFWQDPVAQLYNISSIPATFILDREGKILATRLRGKALETKIAELLEN